MVAPKVDLISQAVGSAKYLQPWYPDDLTLALLGPLAKDPIRISRLYLMVDPKVAVDYEPDPRDERFRVDEKRQWCLSKGIAYVPIYFNDALTVDEFALRLAEAKRLLTADHLEQRIEAARVVEEPRLAEDPDVALYIRREALRRLDEGLAAGKQWRGASRTSMLRRFTKDISDEILQRYPRGPVGPEYRAYVAPHTAGG